MRFVFVVSFVFALSLGAWAQTQAPGPSTLRVSVKGDRDPGYGSTSKMIAEAAMCLLQESAATPGGIWTPASAMGHALIQRLQSHAGLSFAVE